MASKNILWTIRVGVFGWTLFCTFIILGLSANAVSKFSGANTFGLGTPAYAGLALAVAIISLISLTPLLVIDFLRRGAITSWVMVELAVTGVLWVLWLASAAESVNGSPFNFAGLGSGCGAFDNVRGTTPAAREALKEAKSLCQQQQALQAFGFLGWLALMGYFFTLLVFTIIAMNRGNKTIWQSTVRDTDFTAQNTSPNVAMKEQQNVMAQQPVYTQQSYTPTNAYPQSPMSTGQALYPQQYPQQQQQLQPAQVQYSTPQV